MGKTEDVIRSFGGQQYRSCYKDLCYVVDVAKGYQPDPPLMTVIVIEASKRARRRSYRSMWRSIARAVENLWDFGDLDALYAYQPCWRKYRPKPHEFVEFVSWRVWNEETHNG